MRKRWIALLAITAVCQACGNESSDKPYEVPGIEETLKVLGCTLPEGAFDYLPFFAHKG